MAYVGGGFGRAGLHSVLEPAAWGVPVAFGPRWRNSRDAALLLKAARRAALEARQRAAAGALLLEHWERWIDGRGAGGRRRAAARGRSWGEDWVRRGRRREMLARAYFVTTPSKVTVRGTMRPAVSTVNSTSLQRLRTRIFTSAMPLRRRAARRAPSGATAP